MAGWALRQWTVVPGARSHAKLLLFPVRDGGVLAAVWRIILQYCSVTVYISCPQFSRVIYTPPPPPPNLSYTLLLLGDPPGRPRQGGGLELGLACFSFRAPQGPTYSLRFPDRRETSPRWHSDL